MTSVSRKVINDIVKGLNPVTGVQIVSQERTLQFEIMNALLRSNSGSDTSGQLSHLVDDLYFFTQEFDESSESKVLNQIVRCAVCDDFVAGINAHELAEDYDIPLTKVLAYLIDEEHLSSEQAVFFTRALQTNKASQKVSLHSVVSFSCYKAGNDKLKA